MQKNPSETRILVLQGGGALGSYQAGAYAALAAHDAQPDWLAGISIGAINAAIIAGNLPERRVARLRAFWNKVSSGLQGASLIPGTQGRTAFNELSSWMATMFGIPGFFAPRPIAPLLSWPGSPQATSYYDTSALQDTLEELIDFTYLNGPDAPRLSVGAVNVRSGNFRYFDNREQKLSAAHIMASGALPPGFPAVEIDGEPYWDGGLVSNTPLYQVIDMSPPTENLCIFQVDLFAAEGRLPDTIIDVAEREKEIRFSSRTRMNTKAAMNEQRLKRAAANLLKKLPDSLKDDPDAKVLAEAVRQGGITVMHLINRETAYDTASKDYEFSRLSVEEHWQTGYSDAKRGLEDAAWKARAIPAKGMVTFDDGKVVHS